jgi:hypothetical protein
VGHAGGLGGSGWSIDGVEFSAAGDYTYSHFTVNPTSHSTQTTRTTQRGTIAIHW